MVVHTIEICSGVGMLGEGLRAGLRYLGIETRTVCHIEREAYPASVLASRIQEKSLDDAPGWSDLLTFDARAWHGAVDCIVAGFPCQDLSVAGKRVGLDGKRSGLFFNILDIADDCGAQQLFLENVAGIASASATVVDEAQELEERAASRVLGELAERGWDAEWLTLSATAVGASHGRARWFCFAWRNMADTTRNRRVQRRGIGDFCQADGRPFQSMQRITGGASSTQLGNPEHDGQPTPKVCGCIETRNDSDAPRAQPTSEFAGSSHTAEQLAYSERQCQQRQGITGDLARQSGKDQRSHGSEQRASFNCGCGSVADTGSSGCKGLEQRRALPSHWGGAQAHGSTEQLCSPLFAPGPNSPDWPGIIRDFPWLAPALSIEGQEDAKAAFSASESLLHREPDGLAARLDFDARAQRLKCCGNGVVALQAATALVQLFRRARGIEQ